MDADGCRRDFLISVISLLSSQHISWNIFILKKIAELLVCIAALFDCIAAGDSLFRFNARLRMAPRVRAYSAFIFLSSKSRDPRFLRTTLSGQE